MHRKVVFFVCSLLLPCLAAEAGKQLKPGDIQKVPLFKHPDRIRARVRSVGTIGADMAKALAGEKLTKNAKEEEKNLELLKLPLEPLDQLMWDTLTLFVSENTGKLGEAYQKATTKLEALDQPTFSPLERAQAVTNLLAIMQVSNTGGPSDLVRYTNKQADELLSKAAKNLLIARYADFYREGFAATY